MNKTIIIFFLSVIVISNTHSKVEVYETFRPGQLWNDTEGNPINAHGGGVLYYGNKYYWFGEYKNETSNNAYMGVMCYSSTDLYNWKNEGVALAVEEEPESLITKGCIIERPKVIYNEKTDTFVMYFHHELKGNGYASAYTGIAVSNKPEGPYKYMNSSRVNARYWPDNLSSDYRYPYTKTDEVEEWWTPEWYAAVINGLYIRRDFGGGQMSRDMTLFVDDDRKAYHIYSSEENLTLHIAELSDDYLSHTGKYIRIAPAGHNEAPAIFKKEGRYYMITSGCTGWEPNAARLLVADEIMGEWTLYPNPCRGEDAELTFYSQSTFILPVEGEKSTFIFMADRWRPEKPIDGRYVWLPIQFQNGLPVIKYFDEWKLN